jgi:hypothetical protein
MEVNPAKSRSVAIIGAGASGKGTPPVFAYIYLYN